MSEPPAATMRARATGFVVAALEHARSLHAAPLAPDVARLHRLFTSERAERRPDYMRDPALRRAYLGFFLPRNAVKVALLLERARAEGALSIPAAPAVLDVGAGPLTGIFGAWIAFGRLGACVAVDAAAASMAAAQPLLATIDHPVIVTRTANLAVQPVARWLGDLRPDLVILANVLNELGDPRRGAGTRERVLSDLVAVLPPSGRALVVEPATRVHGRALMAMRDRLVEGQVASVLSPCRGARACPLLRSPGDWCHGEEPWVAPRAFEELARAAGIDERTLKESHLVLAPRATPAPRVGLRVVGGLMRDRGGTERRYGCGAHGLVTLTGRPSLSAAVTGAQRGGLLCPVPPDLQVEVTPSRAPGAPGAPRGAARPRSGGRGAAGPRRR